MLIKGKTEPLSSMQLSASKGLTILVTGAKLYTCLGVIVKGVTYKMPMLRRQSACVFVHACVHDTFGHPTLIHSLNTLIIEIVLILNIPDGDKFDF